MPIHAAGLGNAIMDALVRLDDDDVLAELGLTRGQMHPVDHDRWEAVHQRVASLGVEVHSGGSCANTMQTMALLGADVLYCGQIGDDPQGHAYAKAMTANVGKHHLVVHPELKTGKCLSLISPKDGERTMLTDLGAAVHLPTIGDFSARIEEAKVLHLTGYLFLGGPVREAAFEAVAVAAKAGVPISLDVADPFVARTIRDDILALFRDHVDIAFLNREEAEFVTGLEPEAALEELSKYVDTVVVKLGSKGSLVRRNGVTSRIAVYPATVADTTGAGDSYAGAFLYGWLQGWTPAQCGELGSRVAALTVGQVGAVVRDQVGLMAVRSLVGGAT